MATPTYSQNGRYTASPSPRDSHLPETSPSGGDEATIRIDGFAQVIEMLKAADPHFRESLLMRIAGRDRELAIRLKRDLAKYDLR